MDWLNEIKGILNQEWDHGKIQFPCPLSMDLKIKEARNDVSRICGFELVEQHDDFEFPFSRLILDPKDDIKECFKTWMEVVFKYLMKCSILMKILGYEQDGVFSFNRKYDEGKSIHVSLNSLEGTSFSMWITDGEFHYISGGVDTYFEPLTPSLICFEKKNLTPNSMAFMNSQLRDLIIQKNK